VSGSTYRSVHAQDASFSWLFSSIAVLSPAMGLQEIANLLWGLAVGRAALSSQQVQVCAGFNNCIVRTWHIM
jgi:hypothetical protein